MIGEMLGGVGGIAGAFIGAGETRRAANMNYQINLLNYYQREKERQQAIDMAETVRRENKLGSTDAMGNRIEFVEGKGWVTTPSSEGRAMQDAQNREQMLTLLVDKPRRREQEAVNERNQRTEDFVARGFLDRIGRTYREDPKQVENLLMDAQRRGINEAFNNSAGEAINTALRTGSSNIDKIMQGVGRARMDATAKAAIDARLQSAGVADKEYNDKVGNLANLYNMFATRASKLPDVSYAPQNVAGASNSLLQQFAQEAGVGGRKAVDTAGAKGGTMDYVKPDMGLANAFASLGGIMGSVGRSAETQMNWSDTLDRSRRNAGAYGG